MDTSDGQFYKAAVQHVLATHDPRIPALGEWQPVDMANSGGQVIVDLSQSVWLGEPGPPEYTEDQLTDAELADFLDAMAEADAEESAAAYSGLAEFDAAHYESYAAEAQREAARAAADLDDLVSPPRSDEDIVARAIARASAGIYDTSRVASFAAPSLDAIELSSELTMATGQGLCGDPDPFGRCSSRYHDLQCAHGLGPDWQASGPHPDTYSMALSNWAAGHDLGPVPASYGDGEDGHPIPQGTLELAHALNQAWGLAAPDPVTVDDLFSQPYRGDAYAAMAAEVGFQDLEQPQLQDYPDRSVIREIRARIGV